MAVLSNQYLDRRIRDAQVHAREIDAWLARRNTNNAKADRRITTDDARIKSLYPTLRVLQATSDSNA